MNLILLRVKNKLMRVTNKMSWSPSHYVKHGGKGDGGRELTSYHNWLAPLVLQFEGNAN